jgi:hypothetical protein
VPAAAVRGDRRAELFAAAGPLSHPARTLLAHLCSLADDNGAMRWGLSTSQLVEATGFSERALRYGRRQLETSGVLRTEVGNGKTRSHYQILLPAAAEQGAPAGSDPERVVDASGVLSGGHAVPPRGAPRAPLGGKPCPPGGHRVPPSTRAGVALRGTGPYGVQDPTGYPSPAASASLLPLPPPGAPPPHRRKPPGHTPTQVALDPLVVELHHRGFGHVPADLDPGQMAEVAAAVVRVGAPAMVQAVRNAHRGNDPARSWRAWVRLWAGMQPPPASLAAARAAAQPPPAADVGVPPPPEVLDLIRAGGRRAAGGRR